MVPTAQGLGRKDCKLRVEESLRRCTEGSSIENSTRLTDVVFESYLWVLGAYELVRSVNQRVQKGDVDFGEEPRQDLALLKKRFERFRIPLAKYEAANKYKEDAPIAYPIVSRDGFVGWAVTTDEFITRQELGNMLLAFLEQLRHAQEQ